MQKGISENEQRAVILIIFYVSTFNIIEKSPFEVYFYRESIFFNRKKYTPIGLYYDCQKYKMSKSY